MDIIKLFTKKNISIILLFFIYCLFLKKNLSYNYLELKQNIKVALCTMGKKENLYAKEYMDYYMKLGVDHMFIYDNNDFDENIEQVLDNKYRDKITIYDTKKLNINHQGTAFTNCYNNNYQKFNWFIMLDMDEYLYIVNDTLKHYLNNVIFDKCDFIKIHWVNTQDNNLLHYDSRSLFQRFKKPYIKSIFIKTIIRGNITNLHYWVHSPLISPEKNVTCTNEGNIIHYTDLNFEYINKINIKKAYIIHFRYKSTEEFLNKYKRGYSDWHGNRTNQVLIERLSSYLQENMLTLEKIKYLENELKLNLSSYKAKINLKPRDIIIRSDLIVN